MKKPFFSIIIPTRNSASHLDRILTSVRNQSYPLLEIIIADNGSSDKTVEKAMAYGAIIVHVHGLPPQVSVQRNKGARRAKGEYLIFLDHDMELPGGFLATVKDVVSHAPQVDAWYIPEKILAASKFFSDMRTFENSCYNNTPVAAARVIRRSIFGPTAGYDPRLSAGPADWDFDVTLRQQNRIFQTIASFLIHHEESLSFWQYVGKKTKYQKACDQYQDKWKLKDPMLYRKVVKKQFDPWYRGIGVFIEQGKWIRTAFNIHLYIGFLIARMFIVWYYYGQSIKEKILCEKM